MAKSLNSGRPSAGGHGWVTMSPLAVLMVLLVHYVFGGVVAKA